MDIRTATLDDIDDVARLLSILRMKTVSTDEINDIFSQTVASPHADVLAAVKDDRLVGIAVVNCVLKFNRIECRLDDVVVDVDRRGGGVGTALLKACNQWAWDRDCYKIEFTSRMVRTGAHALYNRLGYGKRDSNIYTKFSPTTDYVQTKVI